MNSDDDLFRGWCPLLIKSLGANPNGGGLGEVGGIISSEASDFQGETLVQEGVDWAYFRDHGLLNYNHIASEIVGEPTEITRKGDRTLMQGVLYLDKPLAAKIYQNAVAMKKSGARRSYGFSVEGAVLARCPKNPRRILRARVLNVSVCEHPVNPDARMDVLAKAATIGYQQAAGIDSDFSISPLMPQSLDGRRAAVIASVRRSFPAATDEELDRLAAALTGT